MDKHKNLEVRGENLIVKTSLIVKTVSEPHSLPLRLA